MGCKALLGEPALDRRRVVALVQAEVEAHLADVRVVERHTLQGWGEELLIMPIGPVHNHAEDDAAAVHEQATLGPALAAIRRVGPRFFSPPRGAFVWAPSAESQDQSMPWSSS